MAINVNVEEIIVLDSDDDVEVLEVFTPQDFNIPSDMSDYDPTLTPSIFGWDCDICWGSAVGIMKLEEDYINEVANVLHDRQTGLTWVRCFECIKTYHTECWLKENEELTLPFVCCK